MLVDVGYRRTNVVIGRGRDISFIKSIDQGSHQFHEAVSDVMRSLADYDWEFVFVDDGSRDGSFQVIEELRGRDSRVTALRFPRNFGNHVAIAAGIDYCGGDAAVIMAADLQDPPA